MKIERDPLTAWPTLRLSGAERDALNEAARILFLIRGEMAGLDPEFEDSAQGIDVVLAAHLCQEIAGEGSLDGAPPEEWRQ